MKSTRGQSIKMQIQKGFTLVELAIVLVIAGIILVGVLKGTDAINKAKVERMVADIKGLQGSALEFQKRNGRLPGDCNNNAVIELAISAVTTAGIDGVLDKVVRTPDTLRVCGTLTAPATMDDMANNTSTLTGAADKFNLPWNEMRRAGVVDGNRTNEELGRHGFNDIYAFSAMASVAAGTAPNANVIVVYGIPVWMAEAIDAQLDGVATNYGDTSVNGPAATGRVRLWANNTTGKNVTVGTATNAAALFNSTDPVGQFGTDRDALVSISYQFDTMKLVK
ncbi:MAG: prepilin-type N-terminal cleavage/methylation domain-containing protein [Gallionella sp.]|nr:prepilin-type N-terminal cleavage/methylation domain-containing protein [Gallionella sp.]